MTVRSFVSNSEELSALLAVSRGEAPADLVLRNARLVNVFTAEIYPADVAIFRGRIAAVEAGGASSFRGRGADRKLEGSALDAIGPSKVGHELPGVAFETSPSRMRG